MTLSAPGMGLARNSSLSPRRPRRAFPPPPRGVMADVMTFVGEVVAAGAHCLKPFMRVQVKLSLYEKLTPRRPQWRSASPRFANLLEGPHRQVRSENSSRRDLSNNRSKRGLHGSLKAVSGRGGDAGISGCRSQPVITFSKIASWSAWVPP